NQIITQKVIGEEVGRHLAMTEEEAQKFYNEHKSELEQPEAVHLSEILVAPKIPADATPKTTGTDGSPSEPAISADQKAANEAANVIRTKQGYVILKVVEHQAAGIPPLKDVEPKIQDALYYQKLQPALRAYLTKLREEAYIKTAPGFVDTGASPNQTQPIETT